MNPPTARTAEARPRRLLRSVGNFAAFVTALSATCLLLHAWFPPLRDRDVARKLEHLDRHAASVDIVFIGSSRVLHHFDPELFDRELGEHGLPAESFNFGVPAMRLPENPYVTRRALALHPHLKWVLIELWDSYGAIRPENAATTRTIAWHDCAHTWLALRHLWEQKMAWSEKAAQLGWHLRSFAVNIAHVGRANEMVRGDARRKKLAALRAKPAADEALRGFVSLGAKTLSVKDAAQFQTMSAGLHQPRSAVPPSRALLDGWREVIAEIRAAGATPVFVINPSVRSAEPLVDSIARSLAVPVISFADPGRFPPLYDPRLRCEDQHLNREGATAYTRLLAEEFIAAAKTAPAAPR